MIIATYIDHMGTDLSIVNAARVSFGKKSTWAGQEYGLDDGDGGMGVLTPRDQKLIAYLAKHKHLSPFGHCFASFHVKAPIAVARQLVKHKFLRWNEISRRYVDNDPQFHEPENLRSKSSDKKQGSGDPIDKQHILQEVIRHQGIESAKAYKYLLTMGVCEEQARFVLPTNTFTEWYWSGSLDAFADMCRLRVAPDTQEETRQVAEQIDTIMDELFPSSWNELMMIK
jgi:thymidylate synthase (FAD)